MYQAKRKAEKGQWGRKLFHSSCAFAFVGFVSDEIDLFTHGNSILPLGGLFWCCWRRRCSIAAWNSTTNNIFCSSSDTKKKCTEEIGWPHAKTECQKYSSISVRTSNKCVSASISRVYARSLKILLSNSSIPRNNKFTAEWGRIAFVGLKGGGVAARQIRSKRINISFGWADYVRTEMDLDENIISAATPVEHFSFAVPFGQRSSEFRHMKWNFITPMWNGYFALSVELWSTINPSEMN